MTSTGWIVEIIVTLLFMYSDGSGLCRLRMAQSIQRQLEEIEVKQKELEDQGVRLERTLRGEEGGICL